MSGNKIPLAEMDNIHKWYGNVHALKGVDFEVGYEEVVGLIGDNGAGKSTLIKVLCGVECEYEGDLYFEGEKVNFNSPKQAMKMGIETIHQDTALVNTMDVKRNVFLGREPTKRLGFLELLDLEKMAAEAKDALHKIGLGLRSSSTQVQNLSGGQRQGVAIARALYFDTKLLIMDEPTNHLSVKESRKVLRFIEELKQRGVSVIFITHNIHTVYPVADRVVILRIGKKIGDFQKEETSVEKLVELISV